MKNKIENIIEKLNNSLFERIEVIKLAVLAVLAGENIFLIGPPGVAKSLIARRLAQIFSNGTSFEYLMSKYSTPEDIFGPVAISKLKEDIYERKTEKFLPGADIVFLDEIWKAGPSIQNSLLTVMNEKIYRNGEQEVNIKLKGLIAASNELPQKGQGLDALWDRFIIRTKVGNIEDENSFSKFLKGQKVDFNINLKDSERIGIDEFQKWHKEIEKIELTDEAINIIHQIRKAISAFNAKPENSAIYVSDRRWKKITGILKASAFANGRKQTNFMDCFLIGHCIWDDESQIENIKKITDNAILKNMETAEMDKIQKEISKLEKTVEELKNSLQPVPEVINVRNKEYYIIETNNSYINDTNGQDLLIPKSDLKNNGQWNPVNLLLNDKNKKTEIFLEYYFENKIQIHIRASWQNYLFNLKTKNQLIASAQSKGDQFKNNCKALINQIETILDNLRTESKQIKEYNLFINESNIKIAEKHLENKKNSYISIQLTLKNLIKEYENLI
jgi:MoxR-like ATPase